MDDKYYYKIRSLESEIRWIHDDIKREGFSKLVSSPTKRDEIRKMMVSISRNAESIQSRMGTEFRPEFADTSKENDDQR